VAILDADKEGFLRSARSLIQTIGRAARNVGGEVIMYGDRITAAMKQALEETGRRRQLQAEYNKTHGITPATVTKAITQMMPGSGAEDYVTVPILRPGEQGANKDEMLEELRAEMMVLAEQLEFEQAARVRDRIVALEQSAPGTAPAAGASARAATRPPARAKARGKRKR
jgi:excinuclease ABC subunit B